MKPKMIAVATALNTMFFSAPANGEKPIFTKVLRLTQARECYGCDLREANLTEYI